MAPVTIKVTKIKNDSKLVNNPADNPTEAAPPGVSIITCSNRPSQVHNVFENYARQDFEPKELIVILNNNSMDLNEWQAAAADYPDAVVYRCDEKCSLGSCLNLAVHKSKYSYIARFDDDDYYAPNFLKDPVAALNEGRCDIAGKTCRYIYFQDRSVLALMQAGKEYSYTNYVVGATMVIKREVFKRVRFPDITLGDDSDFQQACRRRKLRIYAVDKYNYVTIRHSATLSHTFLLDDDSYLALCHSKVDTTDFISLITR